MSSLNATLILLSLFTIITVSTIVQGEIIGLCVSGFCPEGYRCNEVSMCVPNAAPCVDADDIDCASVEYLCSNGIYDDLITKTCAKTCGRCA